MMTFEWYAALIKPSWAPPAWLFSPVWTILYTIIIISFGYIFYLYYKKKIKFNVLIPFILNLIFNILFSPIQFGLQNNILALVDITLVLITIIWFIRVVPKKYKWVAYVNIPYLIWVSFATFLQINITYLNL